MEEHHSALPSMAELGIDPRIWYLARTKSMLSRSRSHSSAAMLRMHIEARRQPGVPRLSLQD